jgi:hypothetical protein
MKLSPFRDLAALEAFEARPWGQKYPAIAQSWRRHWDQVIPFFAFSPPIRRIIYTTNAIEALNSKLRRAVRARGTRPKPNSPSYSAIDSWSDDRKRPCAQNDGKAQTGLREPISLPHALEESRPLQGRRSKPLGCDAQDLCGASPVCCCRRLKRARQAAKSMKTTGRKRPCPARALVRHE